MTCTEIGGGGGVVGPAKGVVVNIDSNSSSMMNSLEDTCCDRTFAEELFFGKVNYTSTSKQKIFHKIQSTAWWKSEPKSSQMLRD